MSSAPDSQRYHVVQLSVFASCWAFAHLIHGMNKGFLEGPYIWVTELTAFAVIIYPRSILLLFFLAAGQVSRYLFDLPTDSNHWTLMTFVNLAIIIAISFKVLLRGRNISSVMELPKELFFAVQTLLVITYISAVIHKLNFGYFDPYHSSAVWLYHKFLSSPFLYFSSRFIPDDIWINSFIILLSVFIELLLGLLFVFVRLTFWGVLFGVIFHLFLSLRNYPIMAEFSSVMYALYILMLPPKSIWNVVNTLRENRIIQISETFLSKPVIRIIFFISVLLGFYILGNKFIFFSKVSIFSIVWLLYASVFLFGIFKLSQKHIIRIDPSSAAVDLRKSQILSTILYLLIFLFIFNCAKPYFGINRYGAMAMFSNLENSKEQWNHIFIPPIMRDRYFHFTGIKIEESTDSLLLKCSREKHILSKISLANYLEENEEVECSFTNRGELKTCSELRKSFHNRPFRFLLVRKFKQFHQISNGNPEECS